MAKERFINLAHKTLYIKDVARLSNFTSKLCLSSDSLEDANSVVGIERGGRRLAPNFVGLVLAEVDLLFASRSIGGSRGGGLLHFRF